VTLTAPLRPGQSTQIWQDDVSGFLSRILAEACSRVALADADDDLGPHSAAGNGLETSQGVRFIRRLG
jgi:hypothetical protein